MPACQYGKVSVTIEGGFVRAPYYIHGVTSIDDWCEEIRHYPAPWAELQSKNITHTIPSRVIRELDDPASLMDLWEEICALYEEFDGKPLPENGERLVADIQLALGSMHSGYPIVYDWGPEYLDCVISCDQLRSAEAWGYYHEIGHNHQRAVMDFEGCDEVTNNIYTLFVTERIAGIKPFDTDRFDEWKSNNWEGLHNFWSEPSDKRWKAWQDDPFLALLTFALLQYHFGWDYFKKVFRLFTPLEGNEDAEKVENIRDNWLIFLSQTAGYSMVIYFTTWGIPFSKTAAKKVAKLPMWECILPAVGDSGVIDYNSTPHEKSSAHHSMTKKIKDKISKHLEKKKEKEEKKKKKKERDAKKRKNK